MGITDHNGKFFKNIQEMCDYHGISYGCFYQRMKAGYSLEESLTGIGVKGRGRKIPCIDHLGNHFATKKDMCSCYGISPAKFNARIKDGYTLEEALTEKCRRYKKIESFDCEKSPAPKEESDYNYWWTRYENYY